MDDAKNSRVAKLLTKVNIARAVSDHLLGECHPIKHRMWVGGALMTIGVLISKVPGVSFFHLLFDGVGYLIHGAGTIPFIDWFGREKDPDKRDDVPMSCFTPTPEVTLQDDAQKELEVNDVGVRNA